MGDSKYLVQPEFLPKTISIQTMTCRPSALKEKQATSLRGVQLALILAWVHRLEGIPVNKIRVDLPKTSQNASCRAKICSSVVVPQRLFLSGWRLDRLKFCNLFLDISNHGRSICSKRLQQWDLRYPGNKIRLTLEGCTVCASLRYTYCFVNNCWHSWAKHLMGTNSETRVLG